MPHADFRPQFAALEGPNLYNISKLTDKVTQYYLSSSARLALRTVRARMSGQPAITRDDRLAGNVERKNQASTVAVRSEFLYVEG
jgi:hypothetical protein